MWMTYWYTHTRPHKYIFPVRNMHMSSGNKEYRAVEKQSTKEDSKTLMKSRTKGYYKLHVDVNQSNTGSGEQ